MNSNERLYGIDCLRGVAILLVITSHAYITLIDKTIPRYFANGWIGVDLFFAISGFVVARSFINWTSGSDFNKHNFIFRLKICAKYFLRRIVRLLPLAWLWAVINYFLAKYFNESGYWGTLDEVVSSIKAIFLFYHNYFVGNTGNYRLLVYWSLAVEEHYYLFFLALTCIVLLTRKFVSILFLIFLMGVFARMLFYANGVFTDNQFQYYTNFRFDGLILGTILGLSSVFFKQQYDQMIIYFKKLKQINLLRVSVIVFILFIPTMLNQQEMINMGFTFIALGSSVLVLLFSSYDEFNSKHLTISKMLNLIGRRSYSLYLIHFLLMLVFLEARFRMFEVNYWTAEEVIAPVCVIYTLILILITELNYQFLEIPLTKLARKINSTN